MQSYLFWQMHLEYNINQDLEFHFITRNLLIAPSQSTVPTNRKPHLLPTFYYPRLFILSVWLILFYIFFWRLFHVLLTETVKRDVTDSESREKSPSLGSGFCLSCLEAWRLTSLLSASVSSSLWWSESAYLMLLLREYWNKPTSTLCLLRALRTQPLSSSQ